MVNHAVRKRSRIRVGIVGGLALLATVAPATTALAAGTKRSSGGGTPSGSAGPLSQVSQTSWNNPNAPSWCKAEDDYDYRSFSGSLNGSSTATYRLCNPSVDFFNGVWWGAGGEGLETDVYVVGQLGDLTITAPDGTVHHAVLMGQSTSKGVTTDHYATCYVPPYSISSNTGGTPLAGGTWQLTLSGQISSANWTTRDDMTSPTFQQTYCPSSEQNLAP